MNIIDRGMLPHTNTTVGALLAPTSINWKTKRGFYMGGIISPDQRACKCGGRFIKKEFRGANYFSCEKCDKDPLLFRVRRYLPGPYGARGKTVEIRYDQNGKRLKSIQAAHATMEHIDGLISNGKFDPSEFMIKEANNMLLFKNFIEHKYIPAFEKKLERGLIKPPTLISKRGIIKLHLMPFFEKKNIRAINPAMMNEFVDQGKFTIAYKRLILGELKVILGKAHELGMIDSVPYFERQKKARLKDPEKLLTFEQQMKVLDHIDDDRYKVMLNILCLIAIRPSEVRALKWSDWDFKNGKLWIRRHVSDSIVVPGRKSNDDVHSIALSKELMGVIQHMTCMEEGS
jgi:hypothetical protein